MSSMEEAARQRMIDATWDFCSFYIFDGDTIATVADFALKVRSDREKEIVRKLRDSAERYLDVDMNIWVALKRLADEIERGE
jgi:hypothetical protein